MKKAIVFLMTSFLLLAFIPALKAATEITTPLTSTMPVESEKAKALLSRLNEINAMDKANLKRSEKRELRKEVRAIKSELKESRGVYLTVGAVVLIALLLILLL
jgi:Skp family chaperone for outer membrane proteins